MFVNYDCIRFSQHVKMFDLNVYMLQLNSDFGEVRTKVGKSQSSTTCWKKLSKVSYVKPPILE